MKDLQNFITDHLTRMEPLSREVHLAYWNATISGRKEDFTTFAELDLEYQRLYSDSDAYNAVARWRNELDGEDAILQREVDILYRSYLRNQLDPTLIESMTRLSSQIVNKFNVYRTTVDGKELTSNEIRTILRQSRDSNHRKAVWEADKGVGAVVRDDLLKLVRHRNEAARSLGFDNYYEMSLELAEQNVDDLMELFDKLETLTREPFAEMKHEVDAVLAERNGIAPAELRPWHYEDPFFQEAPRVFDIDLDGYYRDKDVVDLVKQFFDSIKLDVGDIIASSDLFEKPGKEQHAYCMDIDRKGDIRVLANVRNDENWTGTMLHELGHAVYDKYIDPDLPFMLREHAHVFATESIAMLFGRMSKDSEWIQQMTGIPDEEKESIREAVAKNQKLGQLVFARWCQVMVRFERLLYEDPEQDLDAAWWRLVEKYQMVSIPEGRTEPDWAAKIHIVSAPVYYHNYMLGELLASQLDHYVQKNVLGSSSGRTPYNGRPEVGEYLKENIFAAGKRFHWDDMIRRATGEALNPKYFVDQFVR